MTSRIVDQGAVALMMYVAAARFGLEEFAIVSVLLVVNSLAVQVSDFGLGYSVLAHGEGTHLDIAVLQRVRRANALVVIVTLAFCVARRDLVGGVVLSCGLVWALSGEAYIWKMARLRDGAAVIVARSEIVSSVVFVVIGVSVGILPNIPVAIGMALVVKHVVEIVMTRPRGPGPFREDGASPAAGPVFLAQVATYLTANVDYVIAGVAFGGSFLSLYTIGFRTANVVPALAATAMTQLALRRFATDRDGASRTRTLRRLAAPQLLLGAIGSLIVICMAPLVPMILGEEWRDAAVIAAAIAVTVPWRLAYGTVFALAVSSSRRSDVVIAEIARLVVTVALELIGAVFFGMTGFLVGVVVASVLSVTGAHAWVARRTGATPYWPLLIAIAVAIPMGVVIVGFY